MSVACDQAISVAARSTRSLDLVASAVPGIHVTYAAGEEIHGEGEPAIYGYRIISGVVRTFRVLPDGRRQVEGFHFHGDVFSMELGINYELSAEAVADTKILVMKRSLIDTLLQNDPAVARELLMWSYQTLARAREQMMLLGRKSASEKVASFLLQLEINPGGEAVAIPMCRSDIADYLGLTVETVSRVLAQLERTHAIDLPSSRKIRVNSREKLAALAGM
ncbi:transcriptional regulator [Terrihabitans soli]|uniref:Transcriptional regulator n=1 Tax=Terrihabitans soli TaxID=708113 RepID=A0A6S6QSQ7_9HYPH|nr:helix-turn-helix domain-containing protein [Terrihabitans soli]BCJ90987.1 transcriptional regulator [Terrihabitans soli]